MDWDAKWRLVGNYLDEYEEDERCFGEITSGRKSPSRGFTKSEPLDEVLWAKEPGSYKCRCPIHEDNEASLSVLITDEGRVVVNCFAGCNWKEVQDYVRTHS